MTLQFRDNILCNNFAYSSMTHLRQTACMYGMYWPTWWWFHLYLKWWSCHPSSRGRWCPGSGRFPGTGWWRWRPHRWDHPAAGETAVVCVWGGEGRWRRRRNEKYCIIWRVFYPTKCYISCVSGPNCSPAVPMWVAVFSYKTRPLVWAQTGQLENLV